ncbi:MAG: Glu/Leu/Phe/Val dehydrogenase dimerization domain-containing protein [Gemmatimonadota bacterium]
MTAPESLFDRMARDGHEQVSFWSEPGEGYRGIIAVHDTTLGPSMGGTRLWSYASDAEALEDALRLSRAMTYKSAIAGLDLGGGKSVIIGDPRTTEREPIFRAHGRAIQSLGGRYYAAEDVGTSADDMAVIRKETRYVSGLPGRSGDPSPLTAYGVFHALRACAIERFGAPSLRGKHVALQGVGHVGFHLCALLAKEGSRLTVTDVDSAKVARAEASFGARGVEPEEIYDVEAEFFSPCALGAVLDDRTIPRLRAGIVAGAANNQLAEPRHEEALVRRGILYAPDYVVNPGGIISVYGELHGWSHDESQAKTHEVHATLLGVFERARADGVSAVAAADRIVEERLAAARRERRNSPGARSPTRDQGIEPS